MKRYIYIDDLREPLISEAEWVKKYTGKFRVHSMNPVGRNNIRSLLIHYGWEEFY